MNMRTQSRKVGPLYGRACALALAALTAVGTARAQERAARPEIAIPKLAKPPTIDGVLADGEWDRAVGLTGFISPTGPLSGVMVPFESKIYLGHDATHFYMAVRCALPPGVKPSMTYRRRDQPVYMDSYQLELWLTPPVRGQLTAYQMIGNAYGAIYDVKQVPDLGAITAGWNANWQFKNTFKQGEYWTAELAVPFADFGETGVKPDEFWGGMVGLGWPQRSWPFTYGWYKNVETHARLFMADGGSCVRVESLDALFDNRLAPKLTLVNGEEKDGEFQVRAAVGDVKLSQTVKVPAGGTQAVALDQALADAGAVQSRACRIEVTGPGGQTLLAGDWLFRPLKQEERTLKAVEQKPWALSTRADFAPLSLGLRMWADLLDHPKRDSLSAVRFTVRPKGSDKAVLSKDINRFDYDAAETYLWLPKDLPYGAYEVATDLLDKDGKRFDGKVDAFEHRDLKKEFVWLNGDAGENITVAPPFEPVTVQGKAAKVWGRELRFEGALPAQVASQGAEMLSGPAALVAVVDGKAMTAKITKPVAFGKTTPERADFTGAYEVAGLKLDLAGRVEFDGMIYYTLTAAPVAKGTTAKVDDLYLSLPVKASHAKYYHTTAGGWSGGFGEIQAGAGKPGETIWSSDTIADFVPYVGLSDDDRAIQWFADNDHDWVLGKAAPCAELRRGDGAVELRVHFVRTPGEVSGFTANFGFIATPVKPLPVGWRHTCLDYGNLADSTFSFFYGPGHGGCPIDPHDTAKLCQALKIDTKGKNPDEVLRDLPAGAAPLDYEHLTAMFGQKTVDEFIKPVQSQIQTPRPRPYYVCYFFNGMMYFEGPRAKAFQALFPGEWQLDPPTGWFHLTTTESYQDFFAFHMDLWLKHWVVGGLYFDECYLPADYNVFNGNGKVMADGSVRPSVPLMQQRRYLQRMRQLFLNHKRTPFIWVHSSNYMAPYAIGAADIAMFGEDRAPTPTTDIIDGIPATLLKSIGRSQKFGLIPSWMVQAGRGGDGTRFCGRQTYGWVWMHDSVSEYHTSPRGWPLAVLRKGWGIAEADVSFIPYWDNAKYFKTSDPKVIVSAWVRPAGKVHFMVMNLHHAGDGMTEATVTLDPKALGLKDGYTVYDLESQPELVTWEKNLREADRLRASDEVANKDAIGKLTANAWGIVSALKYDTSLWQKTGAGLALKLTIPPRDFRAFVAE